MILWPVGVAVAVVWFVFRSSGVDYRMVALGSFLPLVVDLPWGRRAIGHTLLASVLLLAIVMLATMGRGRRLTRRRWLGLPIGVFCGLIASFAFTQNQVFWWPTLGWSFGDFALLPAWGVVVAFELVGAVLLIAVGTQAGLEHADARRTLLRTGRLVETVSGKGRFL